MTSPSNSGQELIPANNAVDVAKARTAGRAVLQDIREALSANKELYVAGEFASADGRFDIHDLFVGPLKPSYKPEVLTALLQHALVDIDLSSLREARMHQNGDMQLPDARVDQKIGMRRTTERSVLTVQTELTVPSESFAAGTTKTHDEDDYTQILVQRTQVRLYPDAPFAKAMFDYTMAMSDESLQNHGSTNLYSIYASHVARAEHLDAAQAAASNATANYALR